MAEGVVERILPHLNQHVAGLVQFTWLTRCRPGEAVVTGGEADQGAVEGVTGGADDGVVRDPG